MTDHLAEAAIQEYALDEEHCPAWMGEHVKGCERCSVQVNNYRLIFKEVGAMEAPVIDVAGMVMMGLSRPKQKKDWSLGYWLAGAGAPMLAAGWFFRNFLLTITGEIPELTLLALVGVSVIIAIVRALRMVRRYRYQLKRLDLS